ncbi:MAG: type II toxin-antitoxin system RelE/ParE family toxin [Verrucomicrobia bacterium]|nr:type II toxin-antitoxin system RelE/ParE family toxin [Verrucomicrobiota bacterium]
MDTAYKKTFLKDLQKLPLEFRSRIQIFALKVAPTADSLPDLGQVVKITGYPAYFRKRFGNYRVGFKFENGKITFYRVLHRRDIYRYFL